jgi:vesicle coat complex subunit
MAPSSAAESPYFDESASKAVEIRQLLNSKFDQERVEAMKHIVAVRS